MYLSFIIFSFISIFSLIAIVSQKKFYFGFKESFFLGLIFYIYLPIFIFYFFQDDLINQFELFYGYEIKDIIKVQYLTVVMLLTFFLGYTILEKKIGIIKNDFFLNKEILISILLLIFIHNLKLPYLQPFILMFILCCLFVVKMKINLIKKFIFLLSLVLLFQYLSAYFVGSRRDIIKILLIFFFFISLIFKSKKFLFILFLTMTIISVIYVFFNTYLRTINSYEETDLTFNVIVSMFEFISYYDFMPAFDHMIYLINNEVYLYGESIFKIFFSLIPREIWTSKPLDTTLLIVELRKNPFVGGSSQSINLIGEAYWNFGWLGVAIISFLVGLFSKNCDLTKNTYISDIQLILLSSLNYIIFVMWRGGISTSIIHYLINMSLLFMILYLSRLFCKFLKYSIKK